MGECWSSERRNDRFDTPLTSLGMLYTLRLDCLMGVMPSNELLLDS